MMRYMSPNEFEDMMRPIVKMAFDQRWTIVRTANGHAKWIPPKGPPIITSVTNAAYKPNISKLRDGGLKMDFIPEEKEEKQEQKAVVHTVIPSVFGNTPVVVPSVKTKQKLPPGTATNHVRDFFRDNPILDFSLQEIQGKRSDIEVGTINAVCITGVAQGWLIRAGRGRYRAAPVESKPKELEGLSKEDQEMLAEDEKVIDNFMNALAELQAWAAKMRKRSIQWNKLKKLLGGAEIE